MDDNLIPKPVTTEALLLRAILEELRALRNAIEDLAKRCQPTK